MRAMPVVVMKPRRHLCVSSLGVLSQLAVIEQALEIASLMLGGQKARRYCLEMICADFLAGANLDVSGRSDSLLLALSRIYLLLPNSQKQEFLLRIPKAS